MTAIKERRLRFITHIDLSVYDAKVLRFRETAKRILPILKRNFPHRCTKIPRNLLKAYATRGLNTRDDVAWEKQGQHTQQEHRDIDY